MEALVVHLRRHRVAVVARAAPLGRRSAKSKDDALCRVVAAERTLAAIVVRQVVAQLCSTLEVAALLLAAQPELSDGGVELTKAVGPVLLAGATEARLAAHHSEPVVGEELAKLGARDPLLLGRRVLVLVPQLLRLEPQLRDGLAASAAVLIVREDLDEGRVVDERVEPRRLLRRDAVRDASRRHRPLRAVLLGVQARGEDCPPADAEERHDDGVGEVRRDERKVLAPRPPARQRVVHAHHALHEGHLE